MNDHCYGVEFDRLGKHWAWCCYDGFVFEITPKPALCSRCSRQWSPIDSTEQEMKRIHADVEQYVDFPYYKTRAADLELRIKTLVQAGEWAVAGLEMLARDEAKKRGITVEMCDWTFTKALRAAVAEAKAAR